MPLRIAFDMDGVLADFESAFRDVELRLVGEDVPPALEQPEARAQEEEQEKAGTMLPPPTRRKLEEIWAEIESTADFWAALKPIDPSAVRRIHEMTLRYRWETFFITQRPRTAGETVQRQTQRWLVEQGFDWPSVLVVPGSRGRAAGALHLDYLVDDSPKNCVDVISDSRARALLIVRDQDDRMVASARRLGIGTVGSIAEALDVLEQATERQSEPTMLDKLARLVGWRS